LRTHVVTYLLHLLLGLGSFALLIALTQALARGERE
jgi:hypothetical protein